jgi:hypothetical protein
VDFRHYRQSLSDVLSVHTNVRLIDASFRAKRRSWEHSRGPACSTLVPSSSVQYFFILLCHECRKISAAIQQYLQCSAAPLQYRAVERCLAAEDIDEVAPVQSLNVLLEETYDDILEVADKMVALDDDRQKVSNRLALAVELVHCCLRYIPSAAKAL